MSDQIPFREKMAAAGLFPLRPMGVEIFQVNMGKMCNQTCKHCHVDAGPTRKEIMSRETMQKLLPLIASSGCKTVDLTGGAPEMNPHFFWFVDEISKLRKEIMVRCNLTIINAHEKYARLPQFFKDHQVHVISSLPYFQKGHTDRQRGDGVFDSSIKALRKLNEVGYGKTQHLKLDLVYNPSGAFFPGDQKALELQFKNELKKHFDIEFSTLLTITNMPIARFLEYLKTSGNLEHYMSRLINAFNPIAAKGVMCRNTLSVGWEGSLYDCDFNQMLDLKVASRANHIDHLDFKTLNDRAIVLGQHCYGCTAGAGSSCGGTIA